MNCTELCIDHVDIDGLIWALWIMCAVTVVCVLVSLLI